MALLAHSAPCLPQLVIPLSVQDDLDKAVELLDRSVHMKSLKILLVLQISSQVTWVKSIADLTAKAPLYFS